MYKYLILLLLSGLIVGCSSDALRRLAPPGIIKYEDLEGDQPPNPAIQAQIDERADSGKTKYPKIADTPSQADRPKAPPDEEIASEIAALTEQRNTILSNVEEDRAAAAEDRASLDELDVRRDDLSEQINKDEIAAQRDRQQNNRE